MFSEPLLDEFQGSATAREDLPSSFCPLGVFFSTALGTWCVFSTALCGFLEAYCLGIFNGVRYM